MQGQGGWSYWMGEVGEVGAGGGLCCWGGGTHAGAIGSTWVCVGRWGVGRTAAKLITGFHECDVMSHYP